MIWSVSADFEVLCCRAAAILDGDAQAAFQAAYALFGFSTDAAVLDTAGSGRRSSAVTLTTAACVESFDFAISRTIAAAYSASRSGLAGVRPEFL